MKQEQQDEAERWLTEALNGKRSWEQVGSEYVEAPAVRAITVSDWRRREKMVFRALLFLPMDILWSYVLIVMLVGLGICFTQDTTANA